MIFNDKMNIGLQTYFRLLSLGPLCVTQCNGYSLKHEIINTGLCNTICGLPDRTEASGKQRGGIHLNTNFYFIHLLLIGAITFLQRSLQSIVGHIPS